MTRTKQYGWITVTQVCFHWRSVAFAKPSLWRYIHIHTRRAGFILERALKTRTLIEFYSTNGDWIKEGEKRLAESLFRDHPQRIRLIHMTRTKAERPYFRVSDKNPPAHPPLDTLLASSKLTALVDVRLDSSYEPWYSLDVWLTWISHLPSLKRLELQPKDCSKASFLGRCFTFPHTLEVLNLRFGRIYHQESLVELDHDPLIKSLQRCSGVQSRLRSLTLTHVCGWAPLPDSLPISTLDLPQLDYLSITGSGPSCGRILRSIIAPPSLRLSVNAYIMTMTGFTVENMIEALSSALLDKQSINPRIKSIMRLQLRILEWDHIVWHA